MGYKTTLTYEEVLEIIPKVSWVIDLAGNSLGTWKAYGSLKTGITGKAGPYGTIASALIPSAEDAAVLLAERAINEINGTPGKAYYGKFLITAYELKELGYSDIEIFAELVGSETKLSFEDIMNMKSLLASLPEYVRLELTAKGVNIELFPDEIKCFVGWTPVQLPDGQLKAISKISEGDLVLSFDGRVDCGRGGLVARRVVRVFEAETREWIKLCWIENGETKELFSTPGHHFLDRFGQFPTIEAMLQQGKATVVLASGDLTEVTAERIVYSAETAHMFERAVSCGAVVGNAALQAVELDAWATYNFEVEDLHTYVAGGVRVHNASGVLGAIGNIFSAGQDRFETDGFWDSVGDGISNFLHDVGSAINGFLPAMVGMVNDILSGEAFKYTGPRVVGEGFVPGTLEVTRPGGGTMMVYKDDPSKEYRPGDTNRDGVLTAAERAASNVDLWERQLAAAEAASDNAARDYAQAQLEKANAEQGKANGGTGGSGGGSSSSKPVLLDLNGNGIEITEFDKSTIFMDGGDGLQHRTAWAGTGDGVLFYDAGNDGKITEKREFVFTEWSPTASGDLEALRAAFDTNGDGKLSAADTDFSKFKVMVTNADGSTTVMTLAALGITEINLTANAVNIALPDGSVITGQTTFTRANGTTGTVANTTLTAVPGAGGGAERVGLKPDLRRGAQRRKRRGTPRPTWARFPAFQTPGLPLL